MVLRCYLTGHPSLSSKKGVKAVVDCPISGYSFKSTGDLRWIVRETVHKLGFEGEIVFYSNENIGTTHMLYNFHVLLNSNEYIGVRIVTRENNAYRILFTIPRREYLKRLKLEEYKPDKDMRKPMSEYYRDYTPGQYYVPNLIVYAILGFPKKIDLSKWRLEVKGLVEKPVSLRLSDLYSIGIRTIRTSFHCVTGWSVRYIEFTGPRFQRLIEIVKPRDSVKWVYVESLDGYSTIIPFEELVDSEALIALEMNRRPLEPEHGYPARLVIPQLYGWKSAKWIHRIEFIEEYRDGYWEALGYHPRGRVDLEERFKRF